MNSSPESPAREVAWQLLRWACVLPAAMICATAAYYASGMVAMVATTVLGTSSQSMFVYWLKLGLFYPPKNAAFVLGGTMMAPRYRAATALGLAAIASGLALLIHVLSQNTVGVVNYAHLGAETLGAICGVLCLVAVMRRQRPARS